MADTVRVTYGPAAARPSPQEAGDRALFVSPEDGQALYQVQMGNWARVAPPPAGAPTLYGPYVVDHTDIATDGATKALWTPQAGDVLLRLWSADRSAVNWDHGTISFGTTGSFGLFAANVTLPTGDDFLNGWAYDYVHPTSAAVEVQYLNPSGPPAAMGHVELYALVARAVAP